MASAQWECGCGPMGWDGRGEGRATLIIDSGLRRRRREVRVRRSLKFIAAPFVKLKLFAFYFCRFAVLPLRARINYFTRLRSKSALKFTRILARLGSSRPLHVRPLCPLLCQPANTGHGQSLEVNLLRAHPHLLPRSRLASKRSRSARSSRLSR